MLQDSDDDEIDDYIYGVLGSSSGGKIQEKMDGFQKIFLGSENGGGDGADDESMELIRKLQAENALDEKYSQFTKSRDEDMEQRYNALRKDPPTFHSTYENGERPKGSVPKPLETDDLHDEMDDWCCKTLSSKKKNHEK
ncbi:uncharacterized protein EV154DRAFT_418522 [Mucor mucedo]|uniref:uncharacterized protein n=1 Tax=Mucor mucedo TaxID=29922 RepID=UPI00221FCE22|nr:uncharacterized protein EV154DRAFT_418522 [Mucor mucedo]KAI7892483.1 hypothetical protein EV154DRAFT_418522 [Mucor mucedo]